MDDALDVNMAQIHSALQLHDGEPIDLFQQPLKIVRRVSGLHQRDLWLWFRFTLRDGVDLRKCLTEGYTVTELRPFGAALTISMTT